MALPEHSSQNHEEIIKSFGRELGKITARLKKQGIPRRDIRYYLAFSVLMQSNQLPSFLETMPVDPDQSAHLIYDPLTHRISWITNRELSYPQKMTTLQKQIQESNYDTLTPEGKVIFHFTPTGEFEIWPPHLLEEKLEPPYF